MTGEAVESWGRYPPKPQIAHDVFWRGDAEETLQQMARTFQTTLPFGLGRSYGDSCLAASGQVFRLTGLGRYISVDWEKGVILAEAGVSLKELIALCLPQGWFPPVVPGTQNVTLGGCVANDVHGKNHHVRGTFGCHVRRFLLVRSDGSAKWCSGDENPDLFRATIGGLGLTGVITQVELQLLKVAGGDIDVTTTRFSGLTEFMALSAASASTHEYTVGWLDTFSKDARGVFMAGKHAEGPAKKKPARRRNIPLTPPLSFVNGLSSRIVSSLYYAVNRNGEQRRGYEPFFFPLDGIGHWNRIYGPKGFLQFQCVLPTASAGDGMRALLARLQGEGQGSFLTVLKVCGDIASPGLLSFPMPGLSFAIDLPNNAATMAVFTALAAIVRDAGGRLYPAKDAMMPAADFRAGYPRWQEVENLRDPALLSLFWQRVAQA